MVGALIGLGALMQVLEPAVEWSWCDRSSKSLDFFIERLVFVNTSKLMRLGQIRGQRSILCMGYLMQSFDLSNT